MWPPTYTVITPRSEVFWWCLVNTHNFACALVVVVAIWENQRQCTQIDASECKAGMGKPGSHFILGSCYGTCDECNFCLCPSRLLSKYTLLSPSRQTTSMIKSSWAHSSQERNSGGKDESVVGVAWREFLRARQSCSFGLWAWDLPLGV